MVKKKVICVLSWLQSIPIELQGSLFLFILQQILWYSVQDVKYGILNERKSQDLLNNVEGEQLKIFIGYNVIIF